MNPPSNTMLAAILDAGFDQQGVGVCVCDAEDRVVHWNRTFRQLFPELADLLQVGRPYRQCLQRVFEIDRPNAAPDEIEQAVDNAGQCRRHRVEPYVLRRQDGSRIRIERCRAAGGHLLSLYRRLEAHELSGELSELSRQAAMLSAINYAATRLISHADWQSVADDLLARLGLASGVSRVLVFKLDQSPDGTMRQSCYCEWTAAGITPVKDLAHNQNALLVTDDPRRRDWQQRHRDGRVIQARVRDLDGYLRAKLGQENVLSVLSVPILVNGRLWGNITFQECRHERVWSRVEIDVLATAALLLAEIIERDQIDTELRESEQRFRSIAEALPIIITRFGEGTVLYASPPAAEMLGVTVEKLIDRRISDFYAATMQRDRLLRKLVRRNGLDDEEVSYRRGDGSLLEATLTARRIVYDGQEAIISALTDLTARKAAEAEVARQREALHQADKMSAMGSLLAGVAHELNNPLAVLVGQALMMEEALSGLPEQRDRAGRIRSAAERCGRIVKTFLAMARQRPALHGEVDLAQVIDAVLDLTAYGIRSSGIRVIQDIAPELPTLWADQDQLSQLVLNLVINAQQALQGSEGSRQLRISVRPIGDEGMCLEVADSGPGIPEDLRSRIFEPFFTTKPAGVGTGIGLALCQNIVLTHGGRIELDHAPEGGALFRVRLPRGRASGSAESAPSGERTEQLPVSTDHEILVVDDEPEIGEMLCDILTEVGYRTRLARSGREALERLSEQHYDLILSDLRMPDLDGGGLYRTLRERWPELVDRLIFVTGDILGGTETFELRQQVPVLEKPFKPEEIKRIVAQRLMANGNLRSGDR